MKTKSQIYAEAKYDSEANEKNIEDCLLDIAYKNQASEDEIKLLEKGMMALSDKEYLEELDRILPLIKNNQRLARLMLYINEISGDDTTPETLVYKFMSDMNKLSGLLADF